MTSHFNTKQPLQDFSAARFTAVISDLHLCEEEPLNPKFPLWKRYKTKIFFFDQDFKEFLLEIERKAGGEKIELVLNGDIFDFDSVTAIPEDATFRVTWLERKRGLHPQEEKSVYKMKRILSHHPLWVETMRDFLKRGHRAVFIIGNHDLDLHFPKVQEVLFDSLCESEAERQLMRINEWFYISNKDTLIEHGNQHDPYCLSHDPISPYVQRFNQIEIKVPFGNLATRYLVNGMGFFNPHADSNFLMSMKEYVIFFVRYIVRKQPLIVLSWLWGSSMAMFQAFFDRLRPSLRDALTIEDRVEWIARKANATPRMVRELQELFAAPAASYPFIIMKELWLDRALIIGLAFLIIFEIFLFIKTVYSISFFWIFIPLVAFLPFFMFYSRSMSSEIAEYKEPREEILSLSSYITKVNRVIYGHTHVVCHEIIGAVEHLNSGTWSPGFKDVECKIPYNVKTYVWIAPGEDGVRESKLLIWSNGTEREWVEGAAQRKARLNAL